MTQDTYSIARNRFHGWEIVDAALGEVNISKNIDNGCRMIITIRRRTFNSPDSLIANISCISPCGYLMHDQEVIKFFPSTLMEDKINYLYGEVSDAIHSVRVKIKWHKDLWSYICEWSREQYRQGHDATLKTDRYYVFCNIRVVMDDLSFCIESLDFKDMMASFSIYKNGSFITASSRDYESVLCMIAGLNAA